MNIKKKSEANSIKMEIKKNDKKLHDVAKQSLRQLNNLLSETTFFKIHSHKVDF